MRIDINQSEKYIDIWLSRGENPPDLREWKVQNKEYQITVFRSGSGNLADLTADLLRQNRDACLDDVLPSAEQVETRHRHSGGAKPIPRLRKRKQTQSR